MKRLATMLLCGACLCTLPGCDDSWNEYMEDYQTLFYFRNGGEQSITLFKIGEDTVYDIPVCKGGRDIAGTGTVRISVMEQAQIDIYNMSNETNYVQLPSDYYSFLTDTEFTFSPDDSYKVASVQMKTDEISELQQAASGQTYILALQLYSDGTVSPGINTILICPSIDIVLVSLATSGIESYAYTSDSPTENVYSNSVSINTDNRWDFSCGLEVCEESWLEAYNEENMTSYVMLPEGSYSIPQSVDFKSGSRSSAFNVTVNRSSMSLLTEYVLPIRLAECTKTQFEINEDQSIYMLNVRLDPDQIALDESMFSSPYTESTYVDGGGLPALCDGTVDYWHGNYSKVLDGDPVYGNYIDIALNEELSDIVLKYQVRSTNGNFAPVHIVIGVSVDGENWTAIGEVSDGLSRVAGDWNTLPPFHSDTAFKYIRFGCAESAAGVLTGSCNGISFALSELELYGANLLN
ncbi:MAG: DUF1735 domain-containing protein [Bacteroidales bacterium]|nr:DUF1735 domain-containing protein [Bacteroidales bacterium]MDE6871981.1 DUF1735 domain-containing protein [Bacteroidales bacterium]